MVGAGLKKFANARGMHCSGGVIYGELYGYNVAMNDGDGIKRMFINTKFPDEAQRTAFDELLSSNDVSSKYRVQHRQYDNDQIIFLFQDKIGTMTLIEAFTDWLLPQLPRFGASNAQICTHCGCQISGNGKWVLINGIPLHMHESCIRSQTEVIRSGEQRIREELSGSYIGGFFGALLGAMLGAAIWAGVMYIGFIAGIVGFLIGFFAEKGYRLCKGKEGKGKLPILIVVILLGLLVGTFLGNLLLCAQALREEGVTTVNAWELMIFLLVEEAEMRLELLKDLAIGVLFSGLSVFGLLRRTKTETGDTSIKILP